MQYNTKVGSECALNTPATCGDQPTDPWLLNTFRHQPLPAFPPSAFQPVVLSSAWFINPPTSGILRFDYASTSTADYYQVSLPEKRFQVILVYLLLVPYLLSTQSNKLLDTLE